MLKIRLSLMDNIKRNFYLMLTDSGWVYNVSAHLLFLRGICGFKC